MSHHQKQYRGEHGKAQRERKNDTSLTNVVSLRISDKEKQVLEKVTKASSKNISEIIREAIDLWLAKRKRLSLEH